MMVLEILEHPLAFVEVMAVCQRAFILLEVVFNFLLVITCKFDAGAQ